MSVNPPPRYVPQNKLTQGMDLVQRYNELYPARAQGGPGAPQEAFMPGPQGGALSPQEAADRETRWARETGQVIGEDRNIAGYVPPQGPQFAANPGVIRRNPEVRWPDYGPYRSPAPQPDPRMVQTNMMQQFAPVQSVQSIDLERGIVWADGNAFPFDLRHAQPVVYFALEVISSAFAAQLGSLLQRYGLAVVPQAMPQVPPGPVAGPVPSGPQGEGGTSAPVQGVSQGSQQAGETEAAGDSPPST